MNKIYEFIQELDNDITYLHVSDGKIRVTSAGSREVRKLIEIADANRLHFELRENGIVFSA